MAIQTEEATFFRLKYGNTVVTDCKSKAVTESHELDVLESIHMHLALGPVLVEFIKKSGERRIMHCTRSAKYGAEYNEITNGIADLKSVKKRNPDVVSAYDIDKQAWRSFRRDSVVCYEYPVNK